MTSPLPTVAAEPHASLPLNLPHLGEREAMAVADAVRSGHVQGGGPYLERVEAMVRERLGIRHALMTTSGTHALEIGLAAHGIGAGAEVVVPTYTHTSTANAVLRQGARVVFADSLADTPHVDPAGVARKLTGRTRAVIAMHYGGIPCGMDELRGLCRDRGLVLLEDAAQAFDSRWRGAACGTLGDGGCLSFHGTKNVGCGEGGALLAGDDEIAARGTIFREMGTDRAAFRTGGLPSYTWRSVGSSCIPADVLMALLEVQLARADEILRLRRLAFERYRVRFEDAERREILRRPVVPEGAEPNGHIFHVLLPDAKARDACRAYLNERGVGAAPHFHPLHATPFGRTLEGRRRRSFPHAERHAARLLRLPLHPALQPEDQDRIAGLLLAALHAGNGSPGA